VWGRMLKMWMEYGRFRGREVGMNGGEEEEEKMEEGDSTQCNKLSLLTN